MGKAVQTVRREVARWRQDLQDPKISAGKRGLIKCELQTLVRHLVVLEEKERG